MVTLVLHLRTARVEEGIDRAAKRIRDAVSMQVNSLRVCNEAYHILAAVAMEENNDWVCSAILTGSW